MEELKEKTTDFHQQMGDLRRLFLKEIKRHVQEEIWHTGGYKWAGGVDVFIL